MEQAVDVEIVEMEVELQVYDKVSTSVDEAMERCAKIVLCYDTPKDVTESRGWIFQNLNKLNPIIKQAHKLGKAEALKFTQAMDAKKNELLEKVAEQIEEKYAPIKLIEEAEAKKKADEEAEAEEERMEACRQAEIEAAQKKLAEEQEELRRKQEGFDRKERDAHIAEEAAKKAKEDAEQVLIDTEKRRLATIAKAEQDAINAENARKQAIVDADNAKAAAVRKAKDEAAAEATEREQALAQERRAQEARFAQERAAEQLRIADVEHRSRIHRAIYSKLIDIQCDKAAAT